MFAAIVGQSWATGAHPYNLEINGIDRIASMHYPATSIEIAGPGSNGSMSFTLQDPTATITINEWDEVRFIEHAATRPILFGGFVQSVRYVAWAAAGRSLVVQCVGYGILLDRKVVPEFVVAFSEGQMAEALVSLVNRFGGRIPALASKYLFPNTDQTDATYGVVQDGSWRVGWTLPATAPAPATLRETIEYVVSLGTWGVDPMPGTYWVDSGPRLMAFYDPGSVDTGDHETQHFADTYPGFQLDTSGTYTVEGLDYEREDTDRLTSAYVVGGNADSTGFYRVPAMERAGDLEGIITDTTASTADDITAKGGPEVNRTTASTARGSVSLSSITPLDLWPGRHLDIANAQVGLTAAQDWRITSVGITFSNSTYRTYVVGFGGSVPAPSMSNRSGRFATR